MKYYLVSTNHIIFHYIKGIKARLSSKKSFYERNMLKLSPRHHAFTKCMDTRCLC